MSSLNSTLLNEQLRGTFISRQVRRANRRVLVLNAVLVLAVLAYASANLRYFSNFVRGPASISGNELASVSNPNSLSRYFVSVNGQKSIDSGIQHVEQQVNETTNAVESQKVDADYLILVVDERFLIVKAPHGATATQFHGALVDLPSDVRSEVVGQVTDPEMVKLLLPVMLDATGFREEGYWTIAICLPILAFAGWNIRKVYLRIQNPSTQPIISTLSQYGSVPEVTMEIESELRGDTEAVGSARVSQHWILISETFGLSLCRMSEIVWAYKKVTKRSVNFIPTGKSYSATVFRRSGSYTSVDGREKEVDHLLQIIASRAPWALLGFTAEIDKITRSNWHVFVAEIDERRARGV